MIVSAIFLAMFGISLFVGLRLRGPRGSALISAFNVSLGLFFIYLLLPAVLIATLNGGRYVWLPEVGGAEAIAVTSTVCLIASAAFILGYLVRIRRRPVIRQVDWSRSKALEMLAWSLIIFGMALKLYSGFASGGIEVNLMRFSGGIRENMGIGAISSTLVAIRNLSGIADAGATWLLLERMRSGRRLTPAIVAFAVVLGATYFGAGKRLFLLWPFLAVILGVHYYVKPIRLSRLPALGAALLGLGFLSLMFRIYAPAYIAGVDIDLNEVDWAQGSLFKFYFFSLEFASFEFLTLALYESGKVIDLFGSAIAAFYTTNIAPFAYFIPRGIWADKPDFFLDVSHAYRVVAMGGELNGAGGGVAATLVGTSWTLGGPLGVVISMLCLGRICRFLDSDPKLKETPRVMDICWYSFWIVTVFHLFRQGTVAWTAIIVVFQQSGLLIGFLVLAVVTGTTRRKLGRYGSVLVHRQDRARMKDAL